jgi:hypothetical protein
VAKFHRNHLFLLAGLAAGLAVTLLKGPAVRGFQLACSAASERSAEHRNPCTGEILHRFYQRSLAAQDGLQGAPLTLEMHHVYSAEKNAVYETVKVEWASFHAGHAELGQSGAPRVRYEAGILGQPKLRCLTEPQGGAVETREMAGGLDVRINLRLSCRIAKGVEARSFEDTATYHEIKSALGQP